MVGIFENLTDFIVNAMEAIQNFTPILGAGAIVIFALMYAFGGQQASQNAKSYGVKVVVGLIIAWTASTLINTLIELSGTTTVDEISITRILSDIKSFISIRL